MFGVTASGTTDPNYKWQGTLGYLYTIPRAATNFGNIGGLATTVWGSWDWYLPDGYHEQQIDWHAGAFNTGSNFIDPNGQADAGAFLVRPANVTPTPIPGAIWLLGSGLAGLIGARKKKK
jgi:hypothetical protein